MREPKYESAQLRAPLSTDYGLPAPPLRIFSSPETRDLYRAASAFSHALRLIGVADLPIVMVERLEDWAVLAKAGASHSADEFEVAGLTFRRERKPVSLATDFYK